MASPWAACRFATCKFPNLKKKFLPPPPKSWLRPCTCIYDTKLITTLYGYFPIESSGVARGAGGAAAPGRRPEGGRQNPAKEFKKMYILRNFKKSEKHNENVVITF